MYTWNLDYTIWRREKCKFWLYSMISSPVGTRLGTQRLPGSGEGGCDIRCRLIAIEEEKRWRRISKEVTVLPNIHSPSIHALPYSSIPASPSYLHPFFPSLFSLPFLSSFFPSYLPTHLLPFLLSAKMVSFIHHSYLLKSSSNPSVYLHRKSSVMIDAI